MEEKNEMTIKSLLKITFFNGCFKNKNSKPQIDYFMNEGET